MKNKTLLLIGAMLVSNQVMAIDLPDSVMVTQTHTFENGLTIEVTSAIIDEKDDAKWSDHFKKQLEEDFKKNPKLLTHVEVIEGVDREPQGSSNTRKTKRAKEFAQKVSNGKTKIKTSKALLNFWSKKPSFDNEFLEKNRSKINATTIRFLAHSLVNGVVFLAGDDPMQVTAAVAGAVLIGALSATSGWYFDFIMKRIVGEPKLSNWLFKQKGNVHAVSAWIESLFKWGLVEIAFTALIKVGFVAMGIEPAGNITDKTLKVLESAGLATLAQGTWELSIDKDRDQALANGANEKSVQKKVQNLALVGSLVSVMGNVATIFELQILDYKPGIPILMTLGVAGVVNLVRLKKDVVFDYGKKVLNRCSRLLGISKDSDHSSNWVISPVQCSV